VIKALALAMLSSPPIWGVLRRRALKDNPLTILCYHTLGPDQAGVNGWTALREGDFRAQLADLQAHYDIVSLDDALDGVGGGRPKAVITFDDGDRGLHAHLLPVLRDIPVPVTIYVATEQFETRQPFWFDRVVNALQGPGEIRVDGLGAWDLPGSDDKAHWDALRPILQALKEVDPSERDAWADKVVAKGGDAPALALGPMTKEELKALADTPGVTIGAHTHGHELLDQIPVEAARASVARSAELLQDWTGQEITHFAFPNGNHTGALREMVKDLGFRSATILEERTAPKGCDPFALPRISAGRYDSAARMRLRLVGL
jgi:peptidoglycan/xylan/chitin deacetylase (PgdA/CDA1 family)